MPIVLQHRNAGLRERMDDPHCDSEKLFETYGQFSTLNRLLGGWRSIYSRYIKPALIKDGDRASLLDIGCGGGDILRMLHGFTLDDQLNVQFTGIDPDKRAVNFARQKAWPDKVNILRAYSDDLVNLSPRYSVVISNHLIHHLTKSELIKTCADAELLATRLVLFSDIERSDVAYSFFGALAPLVFRNSFIAEDGVTSIKRSYRKKELLGVLPDHWNVKRQFPFRLLALNRKTNP